LTGNCAFTPIDRLRAFDEALYILLCGTGLGFSVERQSISKLPVISDSFHATDTTIVVGDSKLGWAKGYKELLSLLAAGEIPKWDLSRIREKGARLKVFGGRASGSDSLNQLFKYTVDTFSKAKGRQLTSIECHGIMCKIAGGVVVGGVRRAALISLSNLSDGRMRDAKSGAWMYEHPEFANANNSVCYTDKPDEETYISEFLALIKSKSGERGIFNRQAVRRSINALNERAENGTGELRRDPNVEYGVNPSLRAGTKVLTTKGIIDIDRLEGGEFQVYVGSEEVADARCIKTSDSCNLYKITLTGGLEVFCSKEHKWPTVNSGDVIKKRTDTLRVGDAIPKNSNRDNLAFGSKGSYSEGFMLGWNLGDGWVTKTSDAGKAQIGFGFYTDDDKVCKQVVHDLLVSKGIKTSVLMNGRAEVNISSIILRDCFEHFGAGHKREGLPNAVWGEGTDALRKGVIDGLFSSDGHISHDRIAFTSVYPKLINELRELLSFYGIKSSIKKVKRPEHDVYISGKKVKSIKQAYVLCIHDKRSCTHFANIFTLTNTMKQSKLEEFSLGGANKRGETLRVVSVEKTDLVEPVWDLQVSHKEHVFEIAGLKTSNCGEVFLDPDGLCNLSEAIIRSGDNQEALLYKNKVATIIGTWQSTLTNFKYVNPRWKRNAEQLRLLGVSMTGIMDNKITNGSEGISVLRSTLNKLRDNATAVNKVWAERLGINPSAAITCVKPSGNTSLLADCASGIHARHSKYYTRLATMNRTDPLAKYMLEKGFPHEDSIRQDSDVLFKFPVKSPEGSITTSDRTALEQLSFWLVYKLEYCDHNPSVTVTVKEGEWAGVMAWCWKNFDNLCGVTFSYDMNYEQAPYQQCNEEAYLELKKLMPEKFDQEEFSAYEQEDNTTISQELACSAGGCEIE